MSLIVAQHPSLIVHLSGFDGPLDLLLHLCSKNQVDVQELQISEITKQYLKTLEMMDELDIEVGAEFVVMATTLCYLKSRSLLPTPPVDEEDDDIADIRTREDLVRRLLEYKKYRDAASQLADRDLLGRDTFSREPVAEDERSEGELEGSLFHLLDALRKLLDRRNFKPVSIEIHREEIPLRERIRWVWQRLRDIEEIDFVELFTRDSTRMEILTTLLALLELVRLGALGVRQDQHLGDIHLRRRWDSDQEVPNLEDEVLSDETSQERPSQEGLLDGPQEQA